MIINKTKKRKIAENYIECPSILSQIRGMMFREKVIPLVFTFYKEKRLNLHSFFCKEMDLVFLNSEYKVIELKKNWKPFSFYFSKKKAKILLELPIGNVDKIAFGDQITIQNKV